MAKYHETIYVDDPAQTGYLPDVEARLAPEIRRMASSEATIIDLIQPPSKDHLAQTTRFRALYQRRLEIDAHTTGNRERERMAYRFVFATIACFALIPILGVYLPEAGYHANDSLDNALLGYNWDLVQFITLISLILVFGLRSLLLVFEPWLSRRLKSADPSMGYAPTVQRFSRRHWRLRLARSRHLPFPVPWLQRYYTCLPITDNDVLACALEHLWARELAAKSRSE